MASAAPHKDYNKIYLTNGFFVSMVFFARRRKMPNIAECSLSMHRGLARVFSQYSGFISVPNLKIANIKLFDIISMRQIGRDE